MSVARAICEASVLPNLSPCAGHHDPKGEFDVRRGLFNLVGSLICGSNPRDRGMTRAFGWPSFAATVVGLELAALQNFFGHSHFTWGDAPTGKARTGFRRFWRYQLTKTVSLGTNLAVTTLLIYGGALPEIANTVAVLVCAVPNYVMSGHYVFGYTSRPCSQDAFSSKAG